MGFEYCPKCASELEEVEVEGESRAACTNGSCDYVNFDNPTPVVAAIVQKNERIILVQNNDWPEDWYGLVSGFLEAEEDPERGMLREIREEIHLEASVESLVGVYPFELMNQVLIVYHATVEGEPEMGEELSDLKQVHIGDVEPWDRGTGPALEDWLKEHR